MIMGPGLRIFFIVDTVKDLGVVALGISRKPSAPAMAVVTVARVDKP